MRRLLLVCASLSLSAAAVGAQGDNQQKFKVSGSVVNGVSGEPVRGAMIDFQGNGPRSVMAGADGHFELDGFAAGSYFVTARRPGFAPTNQQQRIIVGSSTDSVVIKLLPFSKISGRVTDREGEPIDGVQVQAVHEAIINGSKQWQQSQGAVTDETGHFLMEDLPAGSYILHTRSSQLYMMAMQGKSEASRFIYPATFYPDAPSREMAQHIQIAPGEEMKVDMELHSIRAARVSVMTVPSAPNVMGTLNSGDDIVGNGFVPTDQSGMLTFKAVPPGTWKIVIRAFSNGVKGGEEPLYGELQVDVGTTDIDNLKLPLSKLSDIPVVVSGSTNSQVFVQLHTRNGPAQAVIGNQGGELKIPAVSPGTYRVIARPNGTGCVTSVISGSQDLLREQLVVPPGGSVPPIQVVESDNCPKLAMTPNTKGNVTLIVTSTLQGSEPLSFSASNGTAEVDNLSPGEYQIYAFDDVSNLEYANPDVMRDFKSQAVTLEAGQKTSVQVEVNERHAP